MVNLVCPPEYFHGSHCDLFPVSSRDAKFMHVYSRSKFSLGQQSPVYLLDLDLLKLAHLSQHYGSNLLNSILHNLAHFCPNPYYVV